VATAVNLGSAYLQLNRADDALLQFQAAMQLKPEEAAAHNGLGEVALSQKKFDAAVKHFEAALKLAPAANRIHYSLGMAYRGAGDVKQAQAHLEQRGSVGVRPEDPLVDGLKSLLKGEHIHVVQGQLAFKVGRYQDAVAAFTKALEAKPDSVPARINLGASLAQVGEPDKAVEQLQLVLKDHPQELGARFNLATLLRGQKKHEEAVEELRLVLKTSPVDTEALRSLADSLVQLGRADDALHELFKATALAPDNELTVIDLSNLLMRQGRFVEARAVLEGAHRRSPEKGLTAHALARFLATCPDPARRDGARAVELATKIYQARKSLDHAQTLVLALAESGRCDEAASLLKRLIGEIEKSGNAELVTRMKQELTRYEQGSPCRPPTVQEAPKP
ncbi:MAG: tetratricopeptide repeat protein, partial [Candidatus Saccharimonas sp.]|nr:tetratricopeptide repeat protein [Planctomycetaceae bacterium]